MSAKTSQIPCLAAFKRSLITRVTTLNTNATAAIWTILEVHDVCFRSIKEKLRNVSFLRFFGFSKNLSKLFFRYCIYVMFFFSFKSLDCCA